MTAVSNGYARNPAVTDRRYNWKRQWHNLRLAPSPRQTGRDFPEEFAP